MIGHTSIFDLFINVKQRKEFRDWERAGMPEIPPHLVKQKIICEYAARFGIDTFIETGTNTGYMINAMKEGFRKIFSIELDKALYERAQRKFFKYPHIHIMKGDSVLVLPEILSSLSEKSLFWLDAHYSGGITAKSDKETPVMEELRQILRHPVSGHVVLIDDARLFVGTHDYPTIDQIRLLVHGMRPTWGIEVKQDIIRMHDTQGYK